MAISNKICPLTNTYCTDKCALMMGKCVIAFFFETLCEISDAMDDIRNIYLEQTQKNTTCPLVTNKEGGCLFCDCYDEKLECCEFAGQKGLIKKLYDNAMKGLFVDSESKEE